MAKALAQTYREARRSMKAALKDQDPLLIHEWRKQTKYHALQTRLMRMTFPEMLQDRTGAARELAELLGSVQDIEVVLESAKDWDDAPDGFAEGLEERRKALIEDAAHAGGKLFADKPKAWAARLLETNRFGCLPVTQDEKLVGILTEGDFVRFVLRSFDEQRGS